MTDINRMLTHVLATVYEPDVGGSCFLQPEMRPADSDKLYLFKTTISRFGSKTEELSGGERKCVTRWVSFVISKDDSIGSRY